MFSIIHVIITTFQTTKPIFQKNHVVINKAASSKYFVWIINCNDYWWKQLVSLSKHDHYLSVIGGAGASVGWTQCWGGGIVNWQAAPGPRATTCFAPARITSSNSRQFSTNKKKTLISKWNSNLLDYDIVNLFMILFNEG